MLGHVARIFADAALRKSQAVVADVLRQLWLMAVAVIAIGIGIGYGVYAAFIAVAVEYGPLPTSIGFAVFFVGLGGIALLLFSRTRGRAGQAEEPDLGELFKGHELERIAFEAARAVSRDSSPLVVLGIAALAGFLLGRRR